MAIIYGINSISWILIFWSAFCSLTSALGYYEYDLCNFGTYNGTCLTVSKCPTLAESMRGMGLSRTDVGQCGFTVMEEIICCPHVSATNAGKKTNEVFTKDVAENGDSTDVFDSTENNDEVDTCDFGTYRGICVLESQCKDLRDIMNELGLKNTDVGRCGFTPTEQIICCPNRPKSVQAPKGLTDLLKPFQFRPPPENETAASEPNEAIDEWFSSNFKQNSAKSGSLNKQSIDDDNKQTKASTDSNVSQSVQASKGLTELLKPSQFRPPPENETHYPLPSGIPIETNTLGKKGNIDKEKDHDIQKMYSILGESPVQSGIPIEKNTLGRQDIFAKKKDQHNQKISSIFAESPVQRGIPIETNALGKKVSFFKNLKSEFIGSSVHTEIPIETNNLEKEDNIDKEKDQHNKKISSIFAESPVQSGIPIETNTLVSFSQRLKSILIGSPVHTGIPIETNNIEKEDNIDKEKDQHNQKISSTFGESPVQSRIPIKTNTLGKKGSFIQRTKFKFTGSPVHTGIPIETNNLEKEGNIDKEKDQHNQKISSIFAESPVQSGISIEKNKLSNLHANEDDIQNVNSILNVNSASSGNPNGENRENIISVYNLNPEPNGLAIQQDFFGNNDFNQNANEKINTTFNNNFAYSGNSVGGESPKDNLCQQNSLSNVMLTQENSLRKQNLSEDDLKKLNRIFDAIPLDSGNTAQKNNCFFMPIPATNAEPSAKNSLQSGNYNEGEISKTNAILNVKTDFSGNTILQRVKLFHQSTARKWVPIEETTSESEHMNQKKNYKTNGIFNVKTISNGNSDNVYPQENKANEGNSVRIHFGENTLLGRHGISLILPVETNSQSIGVLRITQIYGNPHPALPTIRKNTLNGNNFWQHIRM